MKLRDEIYKVLPHTAIELDYCNPEELADEVNEVVIIYIRDLIKRIEQDNPYRTELDAANHGAKLLTSLEERHLHRAYNKACKRLVLALND